LLSPCERAVMELIAIGSHTKRIAVQLEIQGRTEDVHRSNIMRKVGVRTLADLLQFWPHRPATAAALKSRHAVHYGIALKIALS